MVAARQAARRIVVEVTHSPRCKPAERMSIRTQADCEKCAAPMPDFRISPISIVNQIKSNLQDRYDSGYPILKELLQNADDAEARRFRLDVLSGWPNAVSSLLRGPGILVANDGFFREQDESGITSFPIIGYFVPRLPFDPV